MVVVVVETRRKKHTASCMWKLCLPVEQAVNLLSYSSPRLWAILTVHPTRTKWDQGGMRHGTTAETYIGFWLRKGGAVVRCVHKLTFFLAKVKLQITSPGSKSIHKFPANHWSNSKSSQVKQKMGQVKSQIFDLIQINFEVHVDLWKNALLCRPAL